VRWPLLARFSQHLPRPLPLATPCVAPPAAPRSPRNKPPAFAMQRRGAASREGVCWERSAPRGRSSQQKTSRPRDWPRPKLSANALLPRIMTQLTTYKVGAALNRDGEAINFDDSGPESEAPPSKTSTKTKSPEASKTPSKAATSKSSAPHKKRPSAAASSARSISNKKQKQRQRHRQPHRQPRRDLVSRQPLRRKNRTCTRPT
jgi:hypothetical protein